MTPQPSQCRSLAASNSDLRPLPPLQPFPSTLVQSRPPPCSLASSQEKRPSRATARPPLSSGNALLRLLHRAAFSHATEPEGRGRGRGREGGLSLSAPFGRKGQVVGSHTFETFCLCSTGSLFAEAHSVAITVTEQNKTETKKFIFGLVMSWLLLATQFLIVFKKTNSFEFRKVTFKSVDFRLSSTSLDRSHGRTSRTTSQGFNKNKYLELVLKFA